MASGVGVAAVVVGYERRVLGALGATPDPDADRDFSFPSGAVHDVVTPDGGSVFVAESGAGRPVLLLHGHGANLDIFALLAQGLRAEGLRVVALDQRGFGRSSPVPPAYGFAGLVDDAATVVGELDLRGAIVVGHSMGGAVALALAIERRELIAAGRVAALVVMNSGARGPVDRAWTRAWVTASELSVLERLSRYPRHGTVLSRTNFGADARASHVRAMRAAGFDSPVARRRGFTLQLLGIDLVDRLGEIDIPVLVMAGEFDRVVSAAQSTVLADGLRDGRLEVFTGAGHVLPMERAASLTAAIVGLADELDVAGSQASAAPA